MKLIRATKGNLLFHVAERERTLLVELLSLYPRVPAAHQRLSNSGKIPGGEESQRLLDEALAQQRTETKNKLRAFMTDPRRFERSEPGYRLSISPAEVEWLLQVLNDIRVGSWILLGSPAQRLEIDSLNEQNSADVWAMEIAGSFQMHLLEALEGRT